MRSQVFQSHLPVTDTVSCDFINNFLDINWIFITIEICNLSLHGVVFHINTITFTNYHLDNFFLHWFSNSNQFSLWICKTRAYNPQHYSRGKLYFLRPMSRLPEVVGGSCPPHYCQDSAQNCLEPPSKEEGRCSLDSQTVPPPPHHGYASYLC